ncbi:MAG: SusC/RagA family TonB-linked outer membrane protein [Gemmatimonadota bacterium]|nr:MAG: SusC/RagA family TonB-linked outer membrane protein [Gemmatimonadota bacterium]
MRLNIGLLSVCFLLVLGIADLAAQTRVVTGRVTDATTGEPLSDVEVMVSNTTIRTMTREDGTFSLGVPVGRVSILIRRIGYRRSLIDLPSSENTIEASLEADILQLEEVVVTGAATGIERRNLANSVETVSAEELAAAPPAATIEHSIQGKVAGANIQSNSGAPGGGVQVELRGVTSINATAQPLYVIDGVIVSDVAVSSNINAITAAAGGTNPSLAQDNQVNRIVDLNPSDIESIEILKGPSAAAIYGSQASSGVILIRTKRGRSGRPQINFTQRFGTFDLANKLGTRRFETAEELDEFFGPGFADSIGFDPNNVFDHEQELAGRNALSWETLGSVSGGSENTRYFVSGLWKKDAGVIENTGFEKQSLRVNLDQDLGGNVLVQVSTNLLHTFAARGVSNNDNSGTSPYMVFPFTYNIVDLKPDSLGIYPDNPFERSNPLQTLALSDIDEDVWRMIGSARIEWDAVQNGQHSLKLLGNAGVDFFRQKNSLLFPPELQFEASGSTDGLVGSSLLSNSDNENVDLGASAVYGYMPSSGLWNATTSAGLQYNTQDLNIARVTSKNTVPGQSNIDQATNVQVGEVRQRVENLGLYLQEEVLFKERLLLTVGVRADQTSANTEDDRLFWYPKAAASYRWTIGSSAIEEVKFRAAYGESGNQPLYGQKFTPLNTTVNIGGIPGFQVPLGGQSQVVPTGLESERQREFEFGLDAQLFRGRSILEATVYHRRVSDLILQRQLAPSTGFVSEFFNGGTMRVNGIDASLALAPLQGQDWNWVFRTTFSMNRSKITELPVPAFLPGNAGFGVGLGSFKIEEGQSATQIVGTVPDGDGGTIVGKVGDSNPDFRMGFTNDIRWKGFSLFFLFDWQQGSQIVNLTRLLYDAGGNSIDYETAGEERISTFGEDIRVYIEDATFLKMREITLSYDLPASFVSNLWEGVRYARLSASGRNLLTWTGYSGMDPEVSNFGNQAIGRNIDVAPFPRTRSFWFSIDLGF